ncbi:MAG: hypothetical protein ACK40G_10725 [Cytophagaceae bacterium]
MKAEEKKKIKSADKKVPENRKPAENQDKPIAHDDKEHMSERWERKGFDPDEADGLPETEAF